MYDVVVKNGLVVTSQDILKGDVAVKDGKIAAVAAWGSGLAAEKEIDAKGKYVLPGAIDSHAHLNEPGYTWREDYEHGTAAAGVGGCTTVVDMPLQNEPPMVTGEIMDRKLEKVSPSAYVDYCFWGGLVDYNFDSLKEMDERGCVAFKSFIGPVSSDYVSLNYGQAREALEIIRQFDGRAGFHCEDYSMIKWEEARAEKEGRGTWRDFLDSRKPVSELVATQAILNLAKDTGCKIHICHVSHPSVAQIIKEARQEGLDVTAETCSHYLSLTEEDVIERGSICKCAPPLRTAADVEEMWRYVDEGVLSCIGSDHSPCEASEKDAEKHGVFGAWGGISGIQNIMQVVYSEGVVKRGYDVTLLAKVLSEGPARAFGIYGRKGALKVGFDADIVILDPEREWEITAESLYYLNKISAFVGMKGKGLPVCTMVRGNIVAEEGQLTGQKGYGEFIKKCSKA